MTHKVKARRWEKGWELEIENFGTTQAHRLADAETMARDYIALDTGEAPADIDVRVEVDLGGLETEASEVRREMAGAIAAQRRLTEQSRQLARRLRSTGLSVADTAEVLGVSAQRVSQLTRV